MNNYSSLVDQILYLDGVLNQIQSPSRRLQAGIQYLVETLEAEQGLFFLLDTLSGEVQISHHNLSPLWQADLYHTDSRIQAFARSSLNGNMTTPRPALLENASLEVFAENDHHQGVLILAGGPLDQQASACCQMLSQVIARSYLAGDNRSNFLSDLTVQPRVIQLVTQELANLHETLELSQHIPLWISRLANAEETHLVLKEDQDDQFLIVCSSKSPGWEYTPLPEGPNLVADCLREQAPILYNSAAEIEQLNLEPLKIDSPGSLLAVPLISWNKVYGMILVSNHRGQGFNEYTHGLVSAVGSMIAYTIDTLQLVKDLKIANAGLQTSQWELMRSRNTLRALFDNIPLSYYIIDHNYEVVAVNMARANRAGLDPKEIYGKKCYAALHNRKDPCDGCLVVRTLYSQQSTVRNWQDWLDNGNYKEWEIKTFPIFDEHGTGSRAILLEENVTEQRRLEQKLIQSEKLAAVGQLAAGLVHEINNPLTAVLANAQLIQREPDISADVLESVELIILAGSRARQVVRNLLDLSRKEGYEIAPVDVNETVQKSLSLVNHEIVSRNIRLDVNEEAVNPIVMGSAEHLESVWINLLVNAVDALASAPDPAIELSIFNQDQQVVISISDNGSGIPGESIDHIFEPFFTTKASGQGTGLGLAVCQRIIKQHGGYIQASSKVGMGTQFTIYLPASSS